MTGSTIIAALARCAAALPAGPDGTTQVDREHSEAAAIKLTDSMTGKGATNG